MDDTLSALAFADGWQRDAAEFVRDHSGVVWGATAAYFGYVALGGVNHDLHKHVYTGDENEDVLTRLKKGKPVTFSEDVYEEFFSFKHYFTTYRVHVLTAAAWLLTGVYNLRNPPDFVGKDPATGRMTFDGWWHKRGSGWTYAVTSFVKGLTASALSLRSHSLGFARWPMAACGLYDAASLVIAVQHAINGDVVAHKQWMIRNFGVGAGSIWVRVYAAAWASQDLSFMSDKVFYGEMNNVALVVGFAQGILFSEWWLAPTAVERRKWLAAQIVNLIAYFVGIRVVYRNLRARRMAAAKARGVEPHVLKLGEEFRSMNSM